MIGTILFASSIAFLLLALAAFVLLFNEHRTQKEFLQIEQYKVLGLPEGELVYEGANGLGEPLTSDQFPLTGKPSYVVQLPDQRLVPIEVKPIVCNTMNPLPQHALQMAAYCLILEDYDASKLPTHGILRYTDREFTIDYTPALRKKVIRRLGEMDLCTPQYPPTLQKQKATRCRACIFQPICPVGQTHMQAKA